MELRRQASLWATLGCVSLSGKQRRGFLFCLKELLWEPSRRVLPLLVSPLSSPHGASRSHPSLSYCPQSLCLFLSFLPPQVLPCRPHVLPGPHDPLIKPKGANSRPPSCPTFLVLPCPSLHSPHLPHVPLSEPAPWIAAGSSSSPSSPKVMASLALSSTPRSLGNTFTLTASVRPGS